MNFYCFLADLIVIVHFAYVAFVVGGMAAIIVGIIMRRQWVRNFWFRTIHLLAIAAVAAESLGGVLCPLTTWENSLRAAGGHPNEPGGFIARWAHDLFFFHVSFEQMTYYHVAFGLAVLLAFIIAPPRWPWRKKA